MAENNTNSSSTFTQLSITTQGITFWSPERGGILFKVSYINETLGITYMTPEVVDGKTTYPQKGRFGIALTMDKVQALLDIINEKVIPAYNSGENYNGGVFTTLNKSGVFEIMVKNGEIFANVYAGINELRIPSTSISYRFPKTPVIEKYNSSNGQFESSEMDASFFVFVKALEGFLLCGGNNISGHSARNADKYSHSVIMKYLTEISAKLGISIPQYNNRNNNRYHKAEPSIFETENTESGYDSTNPVNKSEQVQMQEVTSLSSFIN